ncbi:uncharacterized protein LOC143030440 [Oratosquilla oratoria]|uniref:uncharacterized protein LOC143030440 n=1 Tax=Oratosquilla oratoria TaxID=337810 RepID=UPI003F75C826
MPKWNCSYDSARRYRAEWEKKFMLVKYAPDGSGEAAYFVSPTLKQELKKELGEKFTLLVDESTDVGTVKYLCIAIRYCSKKEKRIVTEFVGLIPVNDTKGEALFTVIKAAVTNLGLELGNCIGFANDGASVMTGVDNSVWTRIQQESPDCVQVKCICHSLALCVKHAFEKLPSCLGFLISEIPKWFSKSTVRRAAYKQLFSIMDPTEERKGTSLPFQQASQTRWLARGKVMYSILMNWEELKAYFMCAEQASGADARYKARMISDILNDPINYWYFHCVTPIVMEFEGVNSYFQATDADPQSMEGELAQHHHSLRARVFSPDESELAISEVDFGARFAMKVERYIEMHQVSGETKVQDVKARCYNFLVEAIKQVEKRLPPTRNIYKGLSSLDPSKILSQTARVPYKDLPFPTLRTHRYNAIEQQYRNVLHINWVEEAVFDNKIPDDSVQFWIGVGNCYDTLGNKSFIDLATYALSCLVTPVSNALVERIFSHATIVKTKLRNRLSTRTLDAIIRIRTHLHFRVWCYNAEYNFDLFFVAHEKNYIFYIGVQYGGHCITRCPGGGLTNYVALVYTDRQSSKPL